ncbi:transglutaminase-like domain-containing protein [Desulfitibacter alkalitolerans]|uniref:transglutaminase-like domain-containing protein n=1 Tax=Desulfitibacter alkalitolerans TaxID=264641 RepID=UPI000481297F|nr:transglutaminase-like domain-containing protein [Desulfitibacter alkalitolerans]
MRKISLIIFVVFCALLSAPAAMAAANTYSIDASEASNGAFSISYNIQNGTKVKVMVQKDGTSLYYNIAGRGTERFPVQLGNGAYTIAILENVTGNQYRIVSRDTLNINMSNILKTFLHSIQIVKWEKEDEAISKARELTAGIESDEEKVKAIYEYIVSNYKYDYAKIDKLSYDYLPDINKTLKSKSGICYDFSALFASMLRSVGIPAKLVKGYGQKIQGYHAWNEVYINNKWVTMDTSVDIQFAENNRSYTMYKDSKTYEKVSEF